MHTLLRSSDVCESGTPGFQLPQAQYFPPFLGGQAVAYSYISNLLVQGNFNIRSLYTNNYSSLPSYEATLATLPYPAANPSISFTQDDFDTVKAQLNAEFLAAGNTVTYFAASNAQINNLFNGEEAALPGILTALNLPTDQTVDLGSSAGAVFGEVLTQIVSTFFFGVGVSADAAKHAGLAVEDANAAAIAVSLIGDIISDAASVTSLLRALDWAGRL